MAIEPGQIIGDYEVIGSIGAGGMGAVYKVRNLLSERIDALKVIRPEAGGADNSERFLREIKLQASLKHPNIAVLYTAMRFEGQVLMFMEMLEGTGLDERLRHGALPAPEAVHYVSQCLRALEYAHGRGVIHRDIKPSNLMITANGVVKLLDFGIARSNLELTLTGPGTVVGSAYYMSPEQALGENADERSDLYSVGIMLYEMLIGARPFSGENAYSILKAHIEREPLSPGDINPSLPSSLCAAVMRALRKKREERFASAAEFRAALEEGTPTATYATPVPARTGAKTAAQPSADASTATRIATLLAAEVGPIAMQLVKSTCARTGDLSEVCRIVAQEVGDEAGRQRFLKRCETELNLPALGASGSRTKAPASSAAASQAKSVAWNRADLDRAARALAEELGPLAKVIVEKTARSCASLDELYEKLAEEIPTPAERKRFLASRPG